MKPTSAWLLALATLACAAHNSVDRSHNHIYQRSHKHKNSGESSGESSGDNQGQTPKYDLTTTPVVYSPTYHLFYTDVQCTKRSDCELPDGQKPPHKGSCPFQLPTLPESATAEELYDYARAKGVWETGDAACYGDFKVCSCEPSFEPAAVNHTCQTVFDTIGGGVEGFKYMGSCLVKTKNNGGEEVTASTCIFYCTVGHACPLNQGLTTKPDDGVPVPNDHCEGVRAPIEADGEYIPPYLFSSY